MKQNDKLPSKPLKAATLALNPKAKAALMCLPAAERWASGLAISGNDGVFAVLKGEATWTWKPSGRTERYDTDAAASDMNSMLCMFDFSPWRQATVFSCVMRVCVRLTLFCTRETFFFREQLSTDEYPTHELAHSTGLAIRILPWSAFVCRAIGTLAARCDAVAPRSSP